jgi:hypothetical protein
MKTVPEFPILVSPGGRLVRYTGYFQCPSEIIVSSRGVSFDGWVFRFPTYPRWNAWFFTQMEMLVDSLGAERSIEIFKVTETAYYASYDHWLNLRDGQESKQ